MDGTGTTAEALEGMARWAEVMAENAMSSEDVMANAELIASTALSVDDWVNGRLDLNAKEPPD